MSKDCHIKNGIAYAGTASEQMLITQARALDGMMLLVTFLSGETRLYDAARLLRYPAFKRLEDPEIFKNPKLDHGAVTWADGEIDIAPEAMYAESYVYNS